MAKHEYRIARGEILRMLYRQYPGMVGDNLLRATFVWMTPGVIDGHTAYLVDQHYATREEVDRRKFEMSTAVYLLRIAPKGIQLLEGEIDADPGIELPPL